MAAASNESFGLKIATAFSIALSVVLLISVYFLNSNYNLEFEKRTGAEKKASDAANSLRTTTEQLNNTRTMLGYGPIEDYEAFIAAKKKDDDAVKANVLALSPKGNATISEHKKKAGAKAIDQAQYDAIAEQLRAVVENYANNPDQSSKAVIGRLVDLLLNQSELSTALALNYADIKRVNDNSNKINDEAKKVIETNLAEARTENETITRTGEETRAKLAADVTQKSADLADLDNKLTNLANDSSTKAEAKEKTITGLRASIRDIRNVLDEKQEVMSKPGGRITFVDVASKTVRISVNRNQGVRPLMQFTIFDKGSVGLTTDKPKAMVEITKVGDPARGENDSLARIVRTYDQNDPIRYNDYIFSAGWSYDHPQRYALVGKIDINRDGRDDRGDLIRMIEAAGGVVEFDLSPPNVDRTIGQAAVARGFSRLGEAVPASTGRASGKISSLAFGYVVDRRASTILFQGKQGEPTKEDQAFIEEESRAIKDASDQGVRPLRIEKLLNMLGYDYSAPIEGRRESYDKSSVRELLKPTRPDQKKTTPPAGESADPPK